MLGYVKTYIVAPGSIYGRAKGPLAAMGIQRVHSIHIPALVEIALSRKQAGVFGEARMSGSILAYPTVSNGSLLCFSTKSHLLHSGRPVHYTFRYNPSDDVDVRQGAGGISAWSPGLLLCNQRRA